MQEVNSSGFGNGLALAGLVGSRGYEGDASWKSMAGNGICDLRHEVSEVQAVVKDSEGNVRADIKDAECNLRHDIKDSESNIRRDLAKSEADIRADVLREGQENMAATKSAECAIIKTTADQTLILSNRICEVEKQALKAEYEAKLTAQTVIKELSAKVDHEAERTNDKVDASSQRTQDKIDYGFKSVDHRFDSFEKSVDKQFCDLREKSLADKVFVLSQELQTARLERKICCGCDDNGPGNSGK